MGHATHFLQQLERASLPQAERALRLYHNPQLLAALLLELAPSRGVERVALSLDEGDEGPYLVVTSRGDFVTCLGKGMALHNLYFVNYERFLVLQDKAKDYLQRREMALEMAGDNEVITLLRRLREKHVNLSREEFRAVSSLQPFLQISLLCDAAGTFVHLEDWRPSLLKIKKPRQKHLPALRRYWNRLWSLGHFSLLATLNGRRGLEEYLHFDPNAFSLAWGLFRQGELALAARGAWLLGRIGKPAFPRLKQDYLSVQSPLAFTQSFLGLLAIGARHKKFRHEILPLLYHKKLANNPGAQHLIGLPMGAEQGILAALFNEDLLYQHTLEQARLRFFRQCQEEELPPPFCYDSAEEIPEDLAMTHAANHLGDYLNEPLYLIHLISLIPWIARVEAEAFYFPQSLLDVSPYPFEADYLLELIRRRETFYGTKSGVLSTKKAGRNDPCPCGSGKKYKKCCLLQENKEAQQAREEKEASSPIVVAQQKAQEWIEKQAKLQDP